MTLSNFEKILELISHEIKNIYDIIGIVTKHMEGELK